VVEIPENADAGKSCRQKKSCKNWRCLRRKPYKSVVERYVGSCVGNGFHVCGLNSIQKTESIIEGCLDFIHRDFAARGDHRVPQLCRSTRPTRKAHGVGHPSCGKWQRKSGIVNFQRKDQEGEHVEAHAIWSTYPVPSYS
jgi:hypothetical protein